MSHDEERNLGLCEKYSLSRSLVLSEPAPIIAFSFFHSSVLSSQNIVSNLRSATQILIETHPVLSARFTRVHTLSPGLSRLEKISLEDVLVQLKDFKEDTPEQDRFDEALVEMMNVDLQIESSTIPPWRILWAQMTPTASKAEAGTILLVAFKGHHSLFDGLSAWNIARSFSKSLTTVRPSDRTPTPSVVVTTTFPSDKPCFPPSLESLISTKPSVGKIARIILQEIIRPLLPSPWMILSRLGYPPVDRLPTWTGNQSTDQSHPRKKHVKTITIPPDTVREIVQRSRHQGATLTAFLHTAFTEAIQILNPEGIPLKTCLPVNLRPMLPLTPPELEAGTYVAGLMYDVPSFPSCSDSSGLTTDVPDFWDRTVAFNRWSKDRAVLADAISDWGLLALISEPKSTATPPGSAPSASPSPTGMVSFLKAKAEGQREHSFELSNLGSVRLDLDPPLSSTLSSAAGASTAEDRWKPTRLVFTQAPLPIGPALVLSVVGCELLGGVEIALGWEEGVVDRESVCQLQARFETIVKRELDLMV